MLVQNINSLPANFSFPKVKLLLTDKVSKKTFENAFDETPTPVLVANRKKEDVYSYVSLQVDYSKISGLERLSQYDKAVLNAVNTIYRECGCDTFTMNQLYKVLVSSKTTAVQGNSLDDLRDSLNRLGATRITIDASEEANAYGYKKALFDGLLCPFERLSLEMYNGEKVECIKILRNPVLLDYEEQKNQIARIQMSCLNTPGNKNREKIAIQDYLQDRIVAMKHNKKLSRLILFEHVYSLIDLGKSEAVKKTKVRSFIKSTLTHWVKVGMLQGFEFLKDGAAYKKIRVFP